MVSTKDRKYEVILDRCAVIDAATAVFRLLGMILTLLILSERSDLILTGILKSARCS